MTVEAEAEAEAEVEAEVEAEAEAEVARVQVNCVAPPSSPKYEQFVVFQTEASRTATSEVERRTVGWERLHSIGCGRLGGQFACCESAFGGQLGIRGANIVR